MFYGFKETVWNNKSICDCMVIEKSKLATRVSWRARDPTKIPIIICSLKFCTVGFFGTYWFQWVALIISPVLVCSSFCQLRVFLRIWLINLFLILCILGNFRCYKVREPNFWGKFVFPKFVQKGPRSRIFCFFFIFWKQCKLKVLLILVFPS